MEFLWRNKQRLSGCRWLRKLLSYMIKNLSFTPDFRLSEMFLLKYGWPLIRGLFKLGYGKLHNKELGPSVDVSTNWGRSTAFDTGFDLCPGSAVDPIVLTFSPLELPFGGSRNPRHPSGMFKLLGGAACVKYLNLFIYRRSCDIHIVLWWDPINYQRFNISYSIFSLEAVIEK